MNLSTSTDSSRSSGTVLPRYSACLACRRRKLKCDGRQPSCGRCLAANQNCQYQPFVFKNKARLLQERIGFLQAKIQAIEQQPNASLVSPHPLGGYLDLPPASLETLLAIPLDNRPPTTPLGSLHDTVLRLSSSAPCSAFSTEMGPAVHPNPAELQPPPGVIQRLVDVFMLRKSHCGFELHIGRVLQGLQPGAVEPIIPVLLYAMLLIACHFAQEPSLRAWENVLLESTKREIEENIAQAHGSGGGKYNRLYHLQAMIMLGQYFYFKCRILEGHVYLSQATRFAVALGVHQLDSRNLHHRFAKVKGSARDFGVERWMARDRIELEEAINVWWACAVRDLVGSILNGLPPSVSLDEITTVWPRPLPACENNMDLADEGSSVASLLDPILSYVIADASQDSIHCVQAKGCILMCAAAKLDAERISNPRVTGDWWTRFEQCDRAIQRFLQTMPHPYAGHTTCEVSDLAQVRVAVESSIMVLHSALAEYELFLSAQGGTLYHPGMSLGGHSYKRCMDACRNIVRATLQLEGVHMSYVHMMTGINWMCTAEVLARHIPRLRRSGETAQAQEMEQQMVVMEGVLNRLVMEYPLMSPQANQLRLMRNW